MDFNLTLGDDLCLKSSGAIVLRQGTHLMDNILIALGGKYQGNSGYLEFALPRERKHIGAVIHIAGDFSYSVPSCVTMHAGIGSLQLVIVDGDKVMKSQIFPLEITQSIEAKDTHDESDKNDYFASLAKVISESEQATSDTLNVKREVERKVQDGEFDGATPTIGSNGNWFIDGVDTGTKATTYLIGNMGHSPNAGMTQRAITEELKKRFDIVGKIADNKGVGVFKDNAHIIVGFVFAMNQTTGKKTLQFVVKSKGQLPFASCEMLPIAGDKELILSADNNGDLVVNVARGESAVGVYFLETI